MNRGTVILAVLAVILLANPAFAQCYDINARNGCANVNCTNCAVNINGCGQACPDECRTPSYQSFAVKNRSLYDQLKGRILIKTQSRGEAYWVSPTSMTVYRLGNLRQAFFFFRDHATGISEYNLSRLPTGITRMYGHDSDRDGLSDGFEYAFGTDPDNFNTDRDRYSDQQEILAGFSPWGTGALNLNWSLAAKLKGRILIQAENSGQLWYVNPVDSRRYYIGNEYDALEVIKASGLGITNYNFNRLLRQ